MNNDDDTKRISKSTYIWSHIAVILFHTILGVLLVLTYFYDKLGKVESKVIIFAIGILLIIVSLGSLAPILMDYKRIEID
tara:strand:- start:61 stop:300 length:240 start_codon:yes stop_codon:yes gene_type:complete